MDKSNVFELSERPQYLDALAKLHCQEIPSLKSALGVEHMKLVYQYLMDTGTGKIFVAAVGDEIIGFICGIHQMKGLSQAILKHLSWLKLIWLFVRHPVFVIHVIDHFLYERELHKYQNAVYCASIAIKNSPYAGVAGMLLMLRYKKYVAEHGGVTSGLILSDNEKSFRFYQAHGYQIMRRYLITKSVLWKLSK